MGIITKEVEVRVNAFTIKHYESLGYKIPLRKASKSSFQHTGKEFVYDLGNTFKVKVEDLQKRSNVKIDVECDCCGKPIYNVMYEDYCERIEIFGEYVCHNCSFEHYKESCLKKYGVDNPAKLKEVKEQMAQTSLLRYGTMYPTQSLEVKKKIIQSCVDRYGYSNPSQAPEIREKISQAFYKNGTTPTSRQQLYIYQLYNTNEQINLNFPISYYNVDICLPNEKLVVEIDFGGHNLNVKTGKLTQEEFDQKEIMRNNIIKREGYKTMRIVSRKDKLPSDTVLLQMLSDARIYFITTQHTWQTYDIDKSLLFNAENINGIPYDFGALRTIKDNDIQNQSDIETQQTNKKGA